MKRSFDWMAKPYAMLERVLFGGTFHATRTGLLPLLDDATRVLVLGEGDGRFVAALLARNPRVHVVALDGSQEMLQTAQRRCAPHTERVTFVHANAVEWLATPSPQPFDAVVTTFFLDCLTEAELSRLFERIHVHLAPNARWLWADLVVPERGWQRYFAKLLLEWLYAVFVLTTNITARRLVDPSPHFVAHGWRTKLANTRLAGVLETRLLVRS